MTVPAGGIPSPALPLRIPRLQDRFSEEGNLASS